MTLAVGRAHPITFIGPARIDVVRVFFRVLVDDGIAFVVVALADQPAEDARRSCRSRVFWIKDTGVVVLPVDRRDVVPGDGAPVSFAGVNLRPALDAGKEALDSRTITMDGEPGDGRVIHEGRAVGLENRHQVLRTRKQV